MLPADSGSPEQPLEGYYVNCRVYYGPQQIHFVNPSRNICKPLVKDGVIQDFPGYDPQGWRGYYHRELTAAGALRVDISPYDAAGHTRVIITIQWADRGDDGHFGMDDDTPEITLYSILDEEGRFLHPFRLRKVSW